MNPFSIRGEGLSEEETKRGNAALDGRPAQFTDIHGKVRSRQLESPSYLASATYNIPSRSYLGSTWPAPNFTSLLAHLHHSSPNPWPSRKFTSSPFKIPLDSFPSQTDILRSNETTLLKSQRLHAITSWPWLRRPYSLSCWPRSCRVWLDRMPSPARRMQNSYRATFCVRTAGPSRGLGRSLHSTLAYATQMAMASCMRKRCKYQSWNPKLRPSFFYCIHITMRAI